MCEERTQGNGATTVRVMRQRTRARRGGGIPPTKYRAADGGCSAREESRFSPKRETNACAVCHARSRSGPQPVSPEAKRSRRRRCPSRGAKPSKTRRVAQDCDPMAYMYTPSISPEAVGRIAKRALAGCCKDALIGRFSRASTVAPTVTACWKAIKRQANALRTTGSRHKKS